MTYRKAKPFVLPSDPTERTDLWNLLKPFLSLSLTHEGCWEFNNHKWEADGFDSIEGRNGPSALVALYRPELSPQRVSVRRVLYALYKGEFDGYLHPLRTCASGCCNVEHMRVQKQTPLTIWTVEEIRRLYKTPVVQADGTSVLKKDGTPVTHSQSSLARLFNVSTPTVHNIVTRKTWNNDFGAEGGE